MDDYQRRLSEREQITNEILALQDELRDIALISKVLRRFVERDGDLETLEALRYNEKRFEKKENRCCNLYLMLRSI